MTGRQILGSCLALMLTATTQAALVWSATTIEVTPKPGAETAAATFPFVNTGASAVTIESVRPGCSCTTAMVEKTTYAPGERGVVNALVDLHGFTGVQEKTVSVVSRADAPAATTLLIRVRIPELIEIKPRVLTWRHGEQPAPKEINLAAATSIGVKLTAVSCSDANFNVKSTMVEGGRFRVSVTPFTTEQSHSGVVRLEFITSEQKSEGRTVYVTVE